MASRARSMLPGLRESGSATGWRRGWRGHLACRRAKAARRAKKEKLDRYVVYETSRNGQPWYVLVSGIYASKEEAKRAVTSLPADVQAKNPWAKPLHQVQADLK